MHKERIEAIIKQFNNKKILVVGDFYIDEYITGQTEKFSPEAPVPRVIIKERQFIPGCAGNIAMNLASLGAQVSVLGVIGDDQHGSIMLKQFQEKNINTNLMLKKQDRLTGTFSRLLLQGQGTVKQHVVRMDNENTYSINQETIDELKQQLSNNIFHYDIIFVADYDEADGKGIIKKEILEHLTKIAKQNNKFTVGMSRENIKDFVEFDLVVANEIEAEKATGRKIRNQEEFIAVGIELKEQLQNKLLIITKGKQGFYVFNKSTDYPFHTPSYATDVVDVCGAGDTLSSAFVLAQQSNATNKEAAELASHAAAITISKPGTATVTPVELLATLEKQSEKQKTTKQQKEITEKLKTLDELKQIIQTCHEQNETTIFTNGYFDGLHAGHIKFLQKAKTYNKDAVLIVALNTDRSVRENKGPQHPKLHEDDRALMLSALACVDYVVLFDELTPIKVLKELKPKLLVKGGNFTPEQVVGKEIVSSYGGEVAIIPTQEMRSIP